MCVWNGNVNVHFIVCIPEQLYRITHTITLYEPSIFDIIILLSTIIVDSISRTYMLITNLIYGLKAIKIFD